MNQTSNEALLDESKTNPLMQVAESLKSAFLEMGLGMVNFLPKLLVAIIILCVGIILAKVVRSVTAKILQGIKIDTLTEKSGVQPALAKMGVKGSLAELIPKLLGFFIIAFMVKTSADAAGFTDVSDFINSIFAFIPKLITAFLIMVVGVFVADVLQNAVFNALDEKGLDYANILSKILLGLVIVVFLTVALSQIGIETELLKDTVKILLIGVSIAIALALGLGLKSHANNIVAAVYVRDIYRQGSSIEIDGDLLTIKGTGPVTTKLQKENGEFVVIPNSELVSTKIKGRIAQ